MIPQVSPLPLAQDQIFPCHFSTPESKDRDSSVILRSTSPVSGVPGPQTLAFPQVVSVGQGQISEETLLFLPGALQKQNESILRTVRHCLQPF